MINDRKLMIMMMNTKKSLLQAYLISLQIAETKSHTRLGKN